MNYFALPSLKRLPTLLWLNIIEHQRLLKHTKYPLGSNHSRRDPPSKNSPHA